MVREDNFLLVICRIQTQQNTELRMKNVIHSNFVFPTENVFLLTRINNKVTCR